MSDEQVQLIVDAIHYFANTLATAGLGISLVLAAAIVFRGK